MRLEIRGTNPTLHEVVATARREGQPREVFADVTMEDVIAACRARGIGLKDGRVLLEEIPLAPGADGPPHPKRLGDLAFGIRDQMKDVKLRRMLAEAEAELADAREEYANTSSRDSWAWPAVQQRLRAAQSRVEELQQVQPEPSE